MVREKPLIIPEEGQVISLGTRIRALRHYRGFSTPGLAKAVDIGRSTISSVENGLTKPSPHLLDRIVDVLNTTVDELRDAPREQILEWANESRIDRVVRRPPVSKERLEEEFVAYLLALPDRLLAYTGRTVTHPSGEGSVDWVIRIGRFWKRQREQKEFSIPDLVQKWDDPRIGNRIRFLEVGLASSEELREGFLRTYARVLEDEHIYEQYCQEFNSP